MTEQADRAAGQHSEPWQAECTCPAGETFGDVTRYQHSPDCLLWEPAADPPVDWQARALDAERQLHEMLLSRGYRRRSADVLTSLAEIAEEQLAVLKQLASAEKTGAISSAVIKTSTRGYDIEAKAYAGSEVPVDEALEAYGRLVREASARALNGWVAEVDRLEALREASGK